MELTATDLTVDATVFEVRRSAEGDWMVFETGFAAALSTFADKHDAIAFASGMARARPAAEIRVVATDGTLLGARALRMDAAERWD